MRHQIGTNLICLMKNITILALFALVFTSFGCLTDPATDPGIIIVEPPVQTLIGTDSIFTGDYLGMEINQNADAVYTAVQKIPEARLSVVRNFSTNMAELRTRIPLYDYFLLDEAKGTDSGVQVTLENERVKSIYLNSGKALTQWPVNLGIGASIRLGDSAGSLYAKLVQIRATGSYDRKFERLLLLTKNMSTSFDPEMAKSPQWYFSQTTAPGLWETVTMNFTEGKLTYILVRRYKS
jgi:hypothetical protein